MKRHLIVFGCAALLLTNCGPAWKVLPEGESASGKNYHVQLPSGWMRNTKNQEALVISRDGNLLQTIEIREASHYDAFKKINETSTPDILPSELAELTLALVKNELPASRVALLENKPTQIDGHQGYRMHFTFENSEGLLYEGIITGFAAGQNVFMIKYYAPGLYFFPRDLPVYEALVQSFQVDRN